MCVYYSIPPKLPSHTLLLHYNPLTDKINTIPLFFFCFRLQTKILQTNFCTLAKSVAVVVCMQMYTCTLVHMYVKLSQSIITPHHRSNCYFATGQKPSNPAHNIAIFLPLYFFRTCYPVQSHATSHHHHHRCSCQTK